MDFSMEDKCEHLMNAVVESRKRFGKMCVDYIHKTSLMENKMLNLQLETLSSYRIVRKQSIANYESEDTSEERETDSFIQEIEDRKTRLANLHENINNTQRIVTQLKNDAVTKKVHQPLGVEEMLAVAKKKAKN